MIFKDLYIISKPIGILILIIAISYLLYLFGFSYNRIEYTTESLMYKSVYYIVFAIIVYSINLFILEKYYKLILKKINYKYFVFSMPIIAIAIIPIFSNINKIRMYDINKVTLIYFTLSVLFVSILEELLFRKFLINYFLNYFNKYRSITFSAIIFALVHIVNSYYMNYDLFSVLNQIFFAFGIGFHLGGIYFKTNSIMITVLIHFIINFNFTFNRLIINFKSSVNNSTIFEDLFFLFILIVLTVSIIIFTIFIIEYNSKKYLKGIQ